MNIAIEESRKSELSMQFAMDYFHDIQKALEKKKKEGESILPKEELIFKAFEVTSFEAVKVVIIGQDPYHGIGQAHGLCFSVQEGVRIPPSLRNIFKEIHDDVGGEIPSHGDLTFWGKQGVLLLNSILTVSEKKPSSHKNIGRQIFTDEVIRHISNQKEGVVFLLRGNFAKGKSCLIDEDRHFVLQAHHPSPFSAHSGFFGCRHFSKANEYLLKQGATPINRLK